jgi:putative membrane protein
MLMDRRIVVAGSALLAPLAALAQSTGGRDPELQYVLDTLAESATALELSRLAQERAADEAIKRFAKLELAEQQTVMEVLHAFSRERTELAPQTRPKTESSAKIDQLRAAREGMEFDRFFVDGQLGVHRQLLRIQERYLARGEEAPLRAIASLIAGHVKEHLADLDIIRNRLT